MGTLTEHRCADCGARVVGIVQDEGLVPYWARCECGGTLVASLEHDAKPGEATHGWKDGPGGLRLVCEDHAS